MFVISSLMLLVMQKDDLRKNKNKELIWI
jgi:hypothetical protein